MKIPMVVMTVDPTSKSKQETSSGSAGNLVQEGNKGDNHPSKTNSWSVQGLTSEERETFYNEKAT